MAETILLEQRPCRMEGVVARTLDDETVLLNLTTEEYYSVNEVGTRVWELADGEHTVAAIVDVIVTEYEAERSEVAEDVLALLDELVAEKLVRFQEA